MKRNFYSRNRFASTLKYCICLLALYFSSTPLVSAQTPTIVNVTYESWVKVTQAPVDTAQWMNFPFAVNFDIKSGTNTIKKTILSWATNPDVVEFPMSHGWAGSVNSAGTFNSPSPISTGGTTDVDLTNVIRRNTSDTLVGVPFYFGNVNFGTLATLPLTFAYQTSADNGATWVRQTNGKIDSTGFPVKKIAGFHFHRGIIQDADGTMYAPGYCVFGNADGTFQPDYRVILLKSINGGVTWTYVSTIQYTLGAKYTETTIVRCKDGSILAIFRNENSPLLSRRSPSGSNGATWGTLTTVAVTPNAFGVDPYLHMMPNGILVLSYGNQTASHVRNCELAYSADGNGTTWTNASETFTSGTGLGNKTTAYTSTFSLRNNRIMQQSDRGTYAYYGTTQHPTPNPFSIWYKITDVVLNYRNRIDLKSKYSTGDIAVTTDMTYTDATHPEAGISGAFDASTDYWSGAFKMANSGTYTIDLKDTVALNGLSISLLHGTSQSATISCSMDNVNWTPLKTYSNAVQYTVDFTSFTAIQARYVKVDVTGTAGIVGISEINLFGTPETYEDYAANVIPYDYTASDTTTPGFVVSEAITPLPTGYKSGRALSMDDEDGNNKELRKTDYTASATQTLQFKLRTKGYASGGCVEFRMESGTTNVFRMAVFSNGVIKYYNGTAWGNVGSGPVSVPLDTWEKIKVVANASTNTASVYVNGVLIGSNITKETTSATTMNGFCFSSSGSAAVGDKALFDDVDFYVTSSRTFTTEIRKPAIDSTLANNVKKDSTSTVKNAALPMKISVSPNPADQQVNITVENITKGKLDIYFTNIYGKTVKSLSYMSEGSTFNVTVPTQALPLGVYVITVTQNSNTGQTKLLK